MTEYNKENYCCYYDQGLFIGSTPAGQNTIAMCCFQEKKITDKVTFDHEYLQNLRKQARQHVPRECSTLCKYDNAHNERIRSGFEYYWDNSGQKIKKLHIEQSLICNLTCISCSSLYSSSWSKDYHLFDSSASPVTLKKHPEKVWQHLDLTDLEHVHFTGGEPLLNPDNIKILEHLDSIDRLSTVTLTYNTNGTVRVSPKIIELWSKAKWVRLHFSLDGIESTFEYTRYPATWSEVQENILWYREIKGPCILIEINAIVGIHNVFNLPDFFCWWKTYCQSGNQGDPSHIFVKEIQPSSHGGRVLSLAYLPKKFEQSARDMLQSIIELPGITNLFPLLCKSSSDLWLEYFNKLDQLRGTDWRRSLQGPITTF